MDRETTITETPELDMGDLLHVALWIQAGRPSDPAWRPTITSYLQEDGNYVTPPPPAIITETPLYNPDNPDHLNRWIWAGRPDPAILDADGKGWGPTIQTDLVGGQYVQQVAPTPPGSLTDVAIARQYAGAYQAAEDIIFLLMARVSMALIGAGFFTPQNVNAEGTKFVFYHRAKIEAFKLAGRHPDAGDQLYAAIAGPASIGEFPWLLENDGAILAIFGNGLPRNP